MMKQDAPSRTVQPHQLRQIAVAAEVDPKTVARVIAGLPTRAMQRERVVKALGGMGLERFLPGWKARRARR